jgi:hypothetical protein
MSRAPVDRPIPLEHLVPPDHNAEVIGFNAPQLVAS